MWNEYNGGGGGGGFFNSPNQFGAVNTPTNKAKKGNKRNTRTAPIVISQALQSSDEGIKIWGQDIQTVCIVARVKDIKVQSTKIIYTIEDITGRMKAMFWLDQDATMDGEDKSVPNIMIDTYVQVFGSIKTNRGKKVMIIYKIFTATNINMITFHYLQCVNNRITLEAKSKGIKTDNDTYGGNPMAPTNSMIDIGGSAAGLNQRQLMVYNLIRAAKVEEGTSRVDMQSALCDKMSKTELDKILEWMCGEGHIYSTIDEDHFRATDAS